MRGREEPEDGQELGERLDPRGLQVYVASQALQARTELLVLRV